MDDVGPWTNWLRRDARLLAMLMLSATIFSSACSSFVATPPVSTPTKSPPTAVPVTPTTIPTTAPVRVTATSPLPTPTPSVEEMLQRVMQSVVRVKTSSAEGTAYVFQRLGTRTLFVTNAHVVQGASSVTITNETGNSYAAKVLGRDEDADLAVLAVDALFPSSLLPLGNSDTVRIGDPLYVIGFPLGDSLQGPPTVTRGILSSRRELDGINFVQTDAAVNPGNSGGPVVDSIGEVVGVASLSMGTSAQGINLALPTSLISVVVDQIVTTHKGAPNLANGTWQVLPITAGPDAGEGHTAIWTGKDMIVWGGDNQYGLMNSGAAFDPHSNTWQPTATKGAPTERAFHGAVWTGKEMLVWGGMQSDDKNNARSLSDGGRYKLATNSWSSIASSPLTGRILFAPIWTGQEMIVWGGARLVGKTIEDLGDGARYDPMTNHWTTMSTVAAPRPRWGYTAVWTGRELLVWGGMYGSGPPHYLADGARYNPVTNTWKPMSKVGAPSPRSYHQAVWTGRDMIVWGGQNASGALSSGARYDPSTDTWAPLSATNAPSARSSFSAVWTGSEMIVYGGDQVVPKHAPLADGGRYNPATNTWQPLATLDAPRGRLNQTAVWTGGEMLVWGGTGYRMASEKHQMAVLPNGARYRPPDQETASAAAKQAVATPRSAASPPIAKQPITWTARASMPIKVSGMAVVSDPNGKIYAIGGTGIGDQNGWLSLLEEYDPAANTWTVRSPMPTARGYLGAAVGPDGKIYAMGGWNQKDLFGTVEVYDPKTDIWTVKSSMPTPRQGLAVVTGLDGKIYAIGGDDKGTVEAYDPKTDTWTTCASMPTPRQFFAAALAPDGEIYTFGGDRTGTVEAYDPRTNSWTSHTPLPTPRTELAAVTGRDGKIYVVGGRTWGGPGPIVGVLVDVYAPSTDSWSTQTSMVNARESPGAVLAADGHLYVVGGDYLQPTGPSVIESN